MTYIYDIPDLNHPGERLVIRCSRPFHVVSAGVAFFREDGNTLVFDVCIADIRELGTLG